MPPEKIEQLINKLTRFAEKNPQAYRWRVFALAALGYGYIFFILSMVLICTGVLVFLLFESHLSVVIAKIILVVGGLLYIILRALWVRVPPPQGKVLTREQVPPLFEILDDIRKRFQAPPIHTVLLTDQLNAAIVQIPRLGVFGWQKNYLIVGMPLFQALSVEQFTAVLAHEYGHLSGAHGRWGAWIYRLRQTWDRLISGLRENQSWGNRLFYRFFEWYVPFFNIYSFVLARQEEFEADKYSSEINGSAPAAQALVSVDFKIRFLVERFWKKLYQHADNTEEPLHSPYLLLQKILPQTYDKALTPKEKQQWLREALAQRTNIDDTHPSLADRLTALGEIAEIPSPIKINAATHCFGDHLFEILEEFSNQWKQNIAPQWLERFNYVQQSKEKLKELIEKAKLETLTISECWQRAELVREFYGNDQALPFYQLILKKDPQYAAAYFAIGKIFLEKQHPKTPFFLKKSMECDSYFIVFACEQLHLFYQQQGQLETAQFYLERAQARAQEEQLADLERNSLNYKDNFLEHHLNINPNLEENETNILENLIEQLKEDKTIKRLYLVRKDLQYFPEKPLYVLGIVRTMGLRNKNDNTEYAKNISKIINLPIELLIVVIDDYPKLYRKVKKIPHALIYQKNITWWKKWWILALFLLAISPMLFLLQSDEETPQETPKPIITKTISSVSLPIQDNFLTLAQQVAQFKLNHVLSYDKRLVEGLKLAFETYPPMLADMPTPTVKTTIKQLDEQRFEILYQIDIAHQQTINYHVILSNQPEQVVNNFQAILTTFAQFKTIFQPRRFPNTLNEATLKQLNNEMLHFDTFEYLKQLQFIDHQITQRKESPTILLSAGEMFGWLSFFNNHQRNMVLSDKLAIQSLVYFLMGNYFSSDSSYQQGLLLLALDYPDAALQLLKKRPTHILSQLLSAFVRQDVAFLQKISEEKAAFHQIAWYLMMRAYHNMQASGWTNFFMQRIAEKYPAFIAGKSYIAAQGKVELTRVLTYPYLADVFLQHLKISELFLNVDLSDKKRELIRNPNYKIETDDWMVFYNQLFESTLALKNHQGTLLNANLLRDLLTEEVLNALIISYELAADQLSDLGRADNVLTAIEAVFANTPVYQALQLRQKIKRQQMPEIENNLNNISFNETNLFLINSWLSAYSLWIDDPKKRPEILMLLENYRALQNPNVEGYVQLSKRYNQFYYLPQSQDFLKNAAKLNSFQSSYQVAPPFIKLFISPEIINAGLAYSLNERDDVFLTPEQRCVINLQNALSKVQQNQVDIVINDLLMSLETRAIHQPEYELALQWLKQLKLSAQVNSPIK
jgi:Zn-dependent protease with chaperone function